MSAKAEALIFISGESDQSSLIQALEDPPPEEAYNAAFAYIHRIARDEGLDKALDRDNLDVVFAPMDSPICSLSTASGKQVPSTQRTGYVSEQDAQATRSPTYPWGDISSKVWQAVHSAWLF